MNDDLESAFDTLSPGELTARRLRERVLAHYDVTQRSLAWEWMDLARERPVVAVASLAAAAVVLLAVTPVGALLVWAV